MTSKHYVKIIEILSGTIQNNEDYDWSMEELAKFFQSDNPNFSKEKFFAFASKARMGGKRKRK